MPDSQGSKRKTKTKSKTQLSPRLARLIRSLQSREVTPDKRIAKRVRQASKSK
jgi:hypothetical protein